MLSSFNREKKMLFLVGWRMSFSCKAITRQRTQRTIFSILLRYVKTFSSWLWSLEIWWYVFVAAVVMCGHIMLIKQEIIFPQKKDCSVTCDKKFVEGSWNILHFHSNQISNHLCFYLYIDIFTLHHWLYRNIGIRLFFCFSNQFHCIISTWNVHFTSLRRNPSFRNSSP